MNIIDIFSNNVKINNQKVAIIYNDKKFTYEDLERDVKKLSLYFESIRIEKGAHLIALIGNSYEFAVLMLTAANLGLVMVPLSITLSTYAIDKIIRTTNSKYVVCRNSFNKKLDIALENIINIDKGLREVIKNEDLRNYCLGKYSIPKVKPYILTMTSGSTGNPKPIVFSQETKIQRTIIGAKELYNLNSDEVIMTASPLYHSLGQRLVLLPLLIGATSVILQKFTPKIWLDVVSKYKVSFTIAISSHLELILKSLDNSLYDLDSLHTLVSSSSLLKEKVKNECIEKFDCQFHECYGASEVGIVTDLFFDDGKNKIGSVGKALDYVDLKIVDDSKKELPPKAIGEIICKTNTAFLNYYNNAKKTEESVINDYFYTKDLGYLDEEGYLYLSGRKKDIIIVGGTNVYPVDIEEVVSLVNGVKECCVIGVDDEYFGEAILCTLIVDEDNFTLRDVKLDCARKLADYQQPMAYEIIEVLPKNALGKIMKHKLKEKFVGYDATKTLRKLLSRG